MIKIVLETKRLLKGQQREMVFWPKLYLRVQKERSQKHFLFGPKVSELGPNLAHLAHQENALIFILRLLLRRTFSFHAFSYNAYFHSPPSPTVPIFIPRPLLLRLFLFILFIYKRFFFLRQVSLGYPTVAFILYNNEDIQAST